MSKWLRAQLEKYGVKTAAIPLGQQQIEGQVLDLPPAIVGRIGEDPSKKTILIYGHFDVQPVSIAISRLSVSLDAIWFPLCRRKSATDGTQSRLR